MFLKLSYKSWEIILIVESGVPKEWAAAAACPPNETNSFSLEITSWILSNASFLTFDSFPNVKAKKLRKISAIIKAKGIYDDSMNVIKNPSSYDHFS